MPTTSNDVTWMVDKIRSFDADPIIARGWGVDAMLPHAKAVQPSGWEDYHCVMRPSCRTVAMGILIVMAAGCSSSDEPSVTSPLESVNPSTAVTLAFEHPDLSGLCERVIADFAEGEPGPSATEQAAIDVFIQESTILNGLNLADGVIQLNGERVGTYKIVDRPGNTYSVESAEWCFTG